jgi:hypothetical protein
VSVTAPGAAGGGRAAVAMAPSTKVGPLESLEPCGRPGGGGTATEDVAATTNDNNDENAGMREMARGMDADDATDDRDGRDDGGGFFGTTAKFSAPVGRGMSSFLSHLRHTGEIRDHSTMMPEYIGERRGWRGGGGRGRGRNKGEYDVAIDITKNDSFDKDQDDGGDANLLISSSSSSYARIRCRGGISHVKDYVSTTTRHDGNVFGGKGRRRGDSSMLMKDVQGEDRVPSFNPLGVPRVKVNVGLEGRCKKNVDEGELDGNDGDVNEGGGNMVCNSSKDAINSNRLPCFLFTLIWLLSEDASDASGILGRWGDSQVWRWYQRMDDGLGPLPTTMGNMTNKGKWSMERQPRVAVETEDGRWTMSNNNREQDDEGKERGEEKTRCDGDMRECTMDGNCLASEKGRFFLRPGPTGPGSALVSELSWQSDKRDCVAICSCSRPEK